MEEINNETLGSVLFMISLVVLLLGLRLGYLTRDVCNQHNDDQTWTDGNTKLLVKIENLSLVMIGFSVLLSTIGYFVKY